MNRKENEKIYNIFDEVVANKKAYFSNQSEFERSQMFFKLGYKEALKNRPNYDADGNNR